MQVEMQFFFVYRLYEHMYLYNVHTCKHAMKDRHVFPWKAKQV